MSRIPSTFIRIFYIAQIVDDDDEGVFFTIMLKMC